MNTIKAEGMIGEQKNSRHSKMTPQILKSEDSISISINQVVGRSEGTETNPISEQEALPKHSTTETYAKPAQRLYKTE